MRRAMLGVLLSVCVSPMLLGQGKTGVSSSSSGTHHSSSSASSSSSRSSSNRSSGGSHSTPGKSSSSPSSAGASLAAHGTTGGRTPRSGVKTGDADAIETQSSAVKPCQGKECEPAPPPCEGQNCKLARPIAPAPVSPALAGPGAKAVGCAGTVNPGGNCRIDLPGRDQGDRCSDLRQRLFYSQMRFDAARANEHTACRSSQGSGCASAHSGYQMALSERDDLAGQLRSCEAR
jgi:hypothetical protein